MAIRSDILADTDFAPPAVAIGDRVMLAKEPVLSEHVEFKGFTTLTLSLTSSEWPTKPGVLVTARLEQLDGKDWVTLLAFTAMSGPGVAHDGQPAPLPSMEYTHQALGDARTVRVHIEASEALALGAVAGCRGEPGPIGPAGAGG